jgi:hypothetical protein
MHFMLKKSNIILHECNQLDGEQFCTARFIAKSIYLGMKTLEN